MVQNNNYCTFYIVRHGQTIWNVEGRWQGQMDSLLTKTGINQAKKLAQKLKDVRFNAAFSSDLLRARRTAEIIALEHKLAVETTILLRERNFGSLEGKLAVETKRDMKEVFDEYALLTGEAKFQHRYVPDMESDEELSLRLVTFLREVAVAYAGKNVLAVCHGAIMRAFLVKIGHFQYKDIANIMIENTAFIKLRSDGVDFFVENTVGIEKRDHE